MHLNFDVMKTRLKTREAPLINILTTDQMTIMYTVKRVANMDKLMLIYSDPLSMAYNTENTCFVLVNNFSGYNFCKLTLI